MVWLEDGFGPARCGGLGKGAFGLASSWRKRDDIGLKQPLVDDLDENLSVSKPMFIRKIGIHDALGD